jgi:pimeloyl-ACP methyl ester carboxylesterase
VITLEKPRIRINDTTIGHYDPSAGKKHLAVITHGYTDNADGWVQQMADSISSRSPDWDVVSIDWNVYAAKAPNTLSPTPTLAANVAIDIGESIGHWLKENNKSYDSVQLVGHSAGSWLVNSLADSLKNNGISSIHLVLLDAYTPPEHVIGVDRPGGPVPVLGANAKWADHIFTSGTLGVLYDLPFTHDVLPNCVNIDVSAVDPNRGALNHMAAHSWPYEWYLQSIVAPNYVMKELGLGFAGRSLETGSLVPGIDGNLRNGDLIVVQSDGWYRLNGTPIGIPWVPVPEKSTVSETGTVVFTTDGTVSLTTGSPVALSCLVDLAQPANAFAFGAEVLSHGPAKLSFYVDGELLTGFQTSEIPDGEVWSSGAIWLDDFTLSGRHTLLFELQPSSEEQAEVRLSNFQFYYADLVPVPEPQVIVLVVGAVACLPVIMLHRRWQQSARRRKVTRDQRTGGQ